MTTIFLTIGFIALFVVLMSLGLIFKGREIKGTCASASPALADDLGRCPTCGEGECKNEDKKAGKSNLNESIKQLNFNSNN